MNRFRSIFKTNKALIGMVHMLPMLGYKDFSSIEETVKCAIQDAKNIERVGMAALIIENNYDIPHQIFVKPEVIASFTYVANQIARVVKIPIGISVLWNDYYSALSIAKIIGASFVRVPVFVDIVETSYGKVTGNAGDVLAFRKKIGGEHIAIFTDIQVKHSKLLNIRPIEESALEAVKKGSDGLIVTGKWTGDAPNMQDLIDTRKAVKDFPLLVGSGATLENMDTLTKYANGIIVGTSIKTGAVLSKEQNVNIKPLEERVSLDKAKVFVKKFAGCTGVGATRTSSKHSKS